MIFLFLAIVIILFFYSTSFIVKNINKIFLQNNEEEISALNLVNYSLVAKKLNFPATPDRNAAVNTDIPATADIAAPAPASSAPIMDKKSITINILNSTSKKGVASALAKILEEAGFSAATTGNEKKSYDLTTIFIKDSKKEYLPDIEKTIKTFYPKAVTETSTDKTDFDVTIIIGQQ